MANDQLNRLLEFANMQMAAEAFLLRTQDNGVLPGETAIRARLELGNTHASKFVPIQAGQFTDKYEVLAQYRNDPLQLSGTGFSATLFKKRGAEEYTLSFRSTEFIDDAVRDNKATNQLEIKELGWAFGQIADMEAWYNELRGSGGPLGGKGFYVTGYSLGGHLATAFNILRREEAAANGAQNPIIETYTFNGAGTGDIRNGRRLTDLLSDFNQIREDYLASPQWNSLSDAERVSIRNRAQARVNEILAEQSRVAGLSGVASITFSGATAPSGGQASLEYQIAALLVGRDTIAVSNFPLAGGANWLPTNPRFHSSIQIAGMTEVVGMEVNGLATSFASNSGLHYGTRSDIYIEDQPLVRGIFPLIVAGGVRKFQGLDFLVDNPAQNDFADTHSLVLLVDSLSLMAAMERLDPNITIAAAGEILAAMSNAKATSVLGTQGTAEGDTLERMLDSLRVLVIGSDQEPTLDYETTLSGNTWHLNGMREPFQVNLATLNTKINDLMAEHEYQIESLVNVEAAQIAAEAGDPEGIAYRYALAELNPFVVVGDADANDALYGAHKEEGQLDLYDVGHEGEMTGVWIGDRAEFLAWKSYRNTENISDTSTLFRQDGRTASLVYTDVKSDTIILLQGSAVDPRTEYILFGSEEDDSGDDALVGAGGEDHLYGGDGSDTLQGNMGDDYLEGGSGDDTYIWNTGDGFDTILDVDGSGKLIVDGQLLAGGIRITQNDFISLDGQHEFHIEGDLNAGGTLTIDGHFALEDFRNGELGITLGLPGTMQDIQATNAEFVPSLDPFRFRGVFATDLDDFVIVGDSFTIDGLSYQGPTAYLGVDGDDLMTAAHDNLVFVPDAYGGAGDDLISTAEAHVEGLAMGGYVEGEGGRDVIFGGEESDVLFGDTSLGALRFESSGSDGIDYFNFRRDYWSFDSRESAVPQLRYDSVSHIGSYFDGEIADAFIGTPMGFSGIAGMFDWLGLTTPAGDAGANDDYISAQAGDDLLVGGAGNDELYGGDGNDFLCGGHGNGFPGLIYDTADLRYDPAFDPRVNDINLSLELSGAGADNIGFIHDLLAQPGDDYLDGGNGNDFLRDRDGGNDVLIGGDGDDVIFDDDRIDNFQLPTPRDRAAHNYLDGGAGDDVITVINRSSGGFDVVAGGDGDDRIQYYAGTGYLDGGLGSDRYELMYFASSFNSFLSPPSVSIHDFSDVAGEVDTLFLPEFMLEPLFELSFSRDESNLYLGLGNDSRWVTIEDWFIGPAYKIEQIVFGNVLAPELDQVYGISAIESRFATPTPDNDLLWGSGADDQIMAATGNDELFGGAGNDVLAGNEGNDTLDGGRGADLYVFNLGDGIDRIHDSGGNDGNGISFGVGITPDMLALGPDGLSITVGSAGDAIQFVAGHSLDDRNPSNIEYLRFADGTALSYPLFLDGTIVDLNSIGLEEFNTGPGAGDPPSDDTPTDGAGNELPGEVAGGSAGGGGGSTVNPGLSDRDVESPSFETPGVIPFRPAIDQFFAPWQAEERGSTDRTALAGSASLDSRYVEGERRALLDSWFDDYGEGQPQGLSDDRIGASDIYDKDAGRTGGRRRFIGMQDVYLSHGPRSDVSGSDSGDGGQTQSRSSIARRWNQIAQYMDAISDERSEDARYSAGEAHGSFDTSSLLHGGAAGGAFGHAGSIGASRGLANFKTLQSLTEGFTSLKNQLSA